MTIPAHELLLRLAGTLRTEIGPAVGDEYTRTQAFMASVILERLGKQVELGPAHAAAESADMSSLADRLASVLTDAPKAVSQAVEAAVESRSVPALGPVVEALYGWGIEQPSAVEALALIRPVLRRDIDRRMEIAR